MAYKRFQRVAVLKGGPSSERDISLRSGAAVANGLRAAGYTVDELDVVGRTLDLPAGIEAAFVALHGEFGEDGQVQTLLNARRIPYTGSGAEASRTACDKCLSKTVFDRTGIPNAPWAMVRAGDPCPLPFPVVVKPPRQGSTIGIHCVRTAADWTGALTDALQYDDRILVEAYIPGRELTVGLVCDEALPAIEVVAAQGWYDYQAKYHSQGATQYLTPAPLSEDQSRQCRDLALKVYRALGCRGMGRVDFRLTPEGAFFVLEMNTIPGFTETSLLPKAARSVGIEFPMLCDRILQQAQIDR
jgi:D-alanine-D-alanine ligase